MSNHTNLFEFDSAPSEFESNLSHFKNHNHVHEDQSASMPMIALYIANLILVTLIGCPLYLAIVHYEQFGCDPQKRSLLNMIFANLCISLMVLMLMLNLFLGIRILVGPLHLWLADTWITMLIFMASCMNLSTITLLVLGNLQLLKPHIVSSINDEFWYIIITSVTLLLSFWPAAQFFHAENDQKWHPPLDYFFTGQEKPHKYRIAFPPFFMLSVLLINVFVYFFLKFSKILKLEPTSEDQSIGQQFNTLKRNPKVFKHIWLLVVFLIDTSLAIVAFFLLKDVPQPVDTSLGGALLLSIGFGFFTPIALWSSNPNLISYTIREFWDIAPMWLTDLRETMHQYYPRSNSIELQPTENSRPDDPPIFVITN